MAPLSWNIEKIWFVSYWIAEFLQYSCEFSCSQIGILLISCTSTHNFARTEYQCCASRRPYSHNYSVKTWWIVFRISCSKINFLQIQITAQIYGGHTILNFYRIDRILWLRGHWTLCNYAGMWWQCLWRWRRLMWQLWLLIITDALNSKSIELNSFLNIRIWCIRLAIVMHRG